MGQVTTYERVVARGLPMDASRHRASHSGSYARRFKCQRDKKLLPMNASLPEVATYERISTLGQLFGERRAAPLAPRVTPLRAKDPNEIIV